MKNNSSTWLLGAILGLAIYIVFLGVLQVIPLSRDFNLIQSDSFAEALGGDAALYEWRRSIPLTCRGSYSLSQEWVMQLLAIEAAHFPLPPLKGGFLMPMTLGALLGSKKIWLVVFGVVLLFVLMAWFAINAGAAIFVFCYGD